MNGNEAAMELFRLYGDEIYRHVYITVGNQADAEDVVQDVFTKVISSWDKFQHKSQPRTWLWRIARNTIHDYVRKKSRERKKITVFDESLPYANVDKSTMELMDTLRDLTPSQKQVFTLRVIEGFTSTEVAEMLGWTKGKVNVTLYRAVARIRKEGEKHGLA